MERSQSNWIGQVYRRNMILDIRGSNFPPLPSYRVYILLEYFDTMIYRLSKFYAYHIDVSLDEIFATLSIFTTKEFKVGKYLCNLSAYPITSNFKFEMYLLVRCVGVYQSIAIDSWR